MHLFSPLQIEPGDRLFFDTAPFIYFLERNRHYFPALSMLLDRLHAVDAQIVTSVVTYIELTTQPARAGNWDLAQQYRDYLTRSAQIALHPLGLEAADQAVRMRAKYGLKTPDAIQLGVAIAHDADYVVTNDHAWKRVTEIHVVLLDELAALEENHG